MTERDRDLTENVFNPEATRETDAGPDAERNRSVPAAGPGSLASPRETASTDPAATDPYASDASAGQAGGILGQEGVAGGESWEGRSRDIGTDGWTTGDAGFGSDTSDDGGPNRDASAGAGESDRSDDADRTDLA